MHRISHRCKPLASKISGNKWPLNSFPVLNSRILKVFAVADFLKKCYSFTSNAVVGESCAQTAQKRKSSLHESPKNGVVKRCHCAKTPARRNASHNSDDLGYVEVP